MRDLAREFYSRGVDVTVLVPSSGQEEAWVIDDFEGIEVIRLKAPYTRDRGNLVRALGEFAMPFAMLRSLRASPANVRRYDGVAWYSPTIFLGPLVLALKRQSDCSAYLILRDIFPQWAADLGIMKRGPAFHLLNQVAKFQYRVADTIGVQAKGNLTFFADENEYGSKSVEVLQNWMQVPQHAHCSINISQTRIAGRQVFVYAGNMGVAQGMDRLLDLATRMQSDPRAGFVFVGRGDAVDKLKAKADERQLTNILFFDEIHPDEIPGLYAQCHVGMVALDPRHTSHNIPGKFISYMHASLPVLAIVNPNNDLVDIINDEGVGFASINGDGADLQQMAQRMLDLGAELQAMRDNAARLANARFSASQAARQIASALGMSNNSDGPRNIEKGSD
ncbi:glycosyltransferase family 4 protein [Allopontixanthobacter confluentis]|nr:glycosyltransferase family 4 protein [Allopontixanthobacter confluentis]